MLSKLKHKGLQGKREKEKKKLWRWWCFVLLYPPVLRCCHPVWGGRRLLSHRSPSPSYSMQIGDVWLRGEKETISWQMQLQWLRKRKWPIIITTPELFHPSVSVGGCASPPWRRTQLISEERRRTTLLPLPLWLEAGTESCWELSMKTLWTICRSTIITM